MSSIRSILEELASAAGLARDNLHVGRIDGQYERYVAEMKESVDLAIKNISELIDGAKPEQYPISELNIGVDEYQSNLKELLK